MAFFEQIGKRLTDAGQGVAQQTKNFSDVTRLNGVISEKERKISRLYASLGQSYYALHKQDPAAEALPEIGQINALFAEIARHREEIKQIKGVVKCPSCGAEMAMGAAFCTACGIKLEQSDSPAQTSEGPVCPNCGKPVVPDDLFCNHCGTKLR